MDLTREEWIKIIPMIIAALIAVTGWGITYFHKWYFDNKTNQLDRVNKQLKELRLNKTGIFGKLKLLLRRLNSSLIG